MSVSQLSAVLREVFSREAENFRRFDVPLTRRLWLYRHQFTSSRDAIYDLSKENVKEYLTDLQNVRARGINAPNGEALRNTMVFYQILSGKDSSLVPTQYAILPGDGSVSAVPGGDIETLSELESKVESEPVIVKPLLNSGGVGVHLLEHSEGRFLFDGEPISRSELSEICTSIRPSIVEERVDQAAYARRIHPDSANTIRILTMVDPDTRRPFIAAAAHRFGSTDSGVVDNWSSGGMSAKIDVETGELSEAVVSTFSDFYGRSPTHPETGTRISGTSIPRWNTIRDEVLDIAAEYRGLWSYVGWDVIVTDDCGGFVLIEGNDWPGIRVHQAHEPLLADDRVRRFYESHGVV